MINHQGHLSWQGQYFVRLEGDIISVKFWSVILRGMRNIGEVGGWHLLLRALQVTIYLFSENFFEISECNFSWEAQ